MDGEARGAEAELVELLRREWGGWRVWRAGGGAGSWMATRRRDLSARESGAGLAQTLMGRDGTELLALLEEDAALERRWRESGGGDTALRGAW